MQNLKMKLTKEQYNIINSTGNIKINAVFEKDPRKIGRIVQKIQIEDVSKILNLKKRNIFIAILAIPATEVQDIVNQLVEAGVGGILNFAPSYLSVPEEVKVINIDIGVSLACLPYYLPISASQYLR